jgi:hypothetical protein
MFEFLVSEQAGKQVKRIQTKYGCYMYYVCK